MNYVKLHNIRQSVFNINYYPSLLHGSLEYFILIGQSVNAAITVHS